MRNLPGVKEFLVKLIENTFPVISSVTLVEIWQGAKENEIEKTRLLLQGFEVISLDKNLAEQAGQLAYKLRLGGFTIGLADAVIGTTALQIRAPLLTTNRKHFEIISGLEVWDLKDML